MQMLFLSGSKKGGEKMNKIKMLILSMVLLVAFAVVPTSFAQSSQNTGTGYTNSDSSVNNPGTGTTTTTTQDQNDRGFNPLWLLPLLAIPLYFILRNTNKDDNDNRYESRAPMAGAKGGRARRNRDEIEEEENL
jgi:hypothetical protein